MKQIVLFITVLAVCAVAAPGDREEIRKAALDYIEGWYDGDGARMESALHPELAKRMVFTNENDKSELHRMGAMSLVQRTRSGGGKKTPNEKAAHDRQRRKSPGRSGKKTPGNKWAVSDTKPARPAGRAPRPERARSKTPRG